MHKFPSYRRYHPIFGQLHTKTRCLVPNKAVTRSATAMSEAPAGPYANETHHGGYIRVCQRKQPVMATPKFLKQLPKKKEHSTTNRLHMSI